MFLMILSSLALLCNNLFTDSAAGELPKILLDKGISFATPFSDDYPNITLAYNRRFDVAPEIVTFPQDSTQVCEIVEVASKLDFNVVARSGGHSYIANGLGGLNGSVVVDLKALREVQVNSRNNTVRVGTGNRLGDIALALGASGRAIPHGTCPYVGIGGHIAYGGFGFTSRMWGLTLDNIASIEVVLPNGTLVNASADEQPELFWALRGAAGSFGITTSIEFRTRQVPDTGIVFTYSWILNVRDASQALSNFQIFLQTNIPADLGPMLFFLPGTPKGYVRFGLTGGWYGNPHALNSTLAPFLNTMPPPAIVLHQTGSFIESLQYLGGGFNQSLNTSLAPDGHDTFYAKSIMTPSNKLVPKSAWERLIDYLANEGNKTSLSWIVEIEVWGGTNSAVNLVPMDDTAFAHRSSLFTFQFYASSANHEPPYPQEGFDFVDGLAKSIIDNSPSDWDYGAYPNYIDDRLVDWQARYYGAHYLKLQAIKKVIDPSNVFTFPTSIEPART